MSKMKRGQARRLVYNFVILEVAATNASEVSDKTGVSLQTARKALKALEKEGCVKLVAKGLYMPVHRPLDWARRMYRQEKEREKLQAGLTLNAKFTEAD